jgi:hypothetical protein
MPKEGEPKMAVKKQLKDLVKIKIIKPQVSNTNHRQTAKLYWTCDFSGCTKGYASYKSLYRHK